MPIYAYRCEHCGHAQDVLQKISDPVLTVCPACGQATYRKQVTAAGFQLKGSGWYVTDFRDGGKKPAAKPEAEKAGASEANGTTGPANGAPASNGSSTNGPANSSSASAEPAKGASASSSGESAASTSATPPPASTAGA